MNNNKFPLSLIAIAVLGIHTTSIAANVQESEVAVDSTQNTDVQTQDASEQTDSPVIKDRILVTGSRLQNGNIVNKPTIITADDIKRRGVTSVEELIRTMPQNLATIGGMANFNSKGPLGVGSSSRSLSAIGALGVSAANIGGMGAGRTLILINGRRVAGAAGIEDGFVNLNGIPLSAIERVEITTDGASAVYGADAMGGVINFVLKSDYSGSTVSIQHENSNNGADNSRISLYTGQTWTSGHVSLTLDYAKRDPIINAKTGYVTNNYAPYFNGDAFYDRRSFNAGAQPGLIDNSVSIYDPETGTYDQLTQAYTVAPGFSGQPTLDDMIVVGREALRDFVPRVGGPQSETKSATISFEQRLTESLVFTADGLFSRDETSQNDIKWDGLSLNLAPGQAYNPFPAYALNAWSPGVEVYYHPAAEIASGELPLGYAENRRDRWNLNLGLTYEISDNTKVDFIYTTSRETTTGNSYRSGSKATISSDPTSPTGWSCYNFDLSQGAFTGEELAFNQALFDKHCAALTSSDPTIAINPWKSSADGSGGSISDFFYRETTEDRLSKMENYELRLTGAVFELPAGEINYAIGGEYNDDGLSSREVAVTTGEAMHRTREGYFIETSIPIFSKAFNVPFAKALTLSIAARRDKYNAEGAIGTVDNILPENGGEIVYGENSFARTTPSYGFNWQPTDELTLRAKWTEGFKAPPYSNLFSITGTQQTTAFIADDPLYDCRANDNCDFDFGDTYYGYFATRTTAPNPNLQPETSKQKSYTLSWNPKDSLSGLTVDITYNNTKIDNEYDNTGGLIRLLPSVDIYALEEFYPRDETGKITEVRNMTFNLVGSEYTSVMYDIRYFFRTDFGNFTPTITYLDNLKSEQQTFSNRAAVSRLGTLGGADDYKINASVRYSYGDLNATLWAYYTPEYINDNEVTMVSGAATNPEYIKSVASFTTIDLTLNYQMTAELQLNFAGRNLFDKAPPFVVVGQLPFDPARYNIAGRTLSLELQYEF